MRDDTILEAIGKGSIKVTMQAGGKMLFTTIIQDLHVLKMKNGFIFISKLILEGLKVEFDRDGCKVNNSMEPLWRKHKGKRTHTFSTSMFGRRVQMWQSFQMKELCFGTKDLATSTWQVLRS
jgi:hypothetical protein